MWAGGVVEDQAHTKAFRRGTDVPEGLAHNHLTTNKVIHTTTATAKLQKKIVDAREWVLDCSKVFFIYFLLSFATVFHTSGEIILRPPGLR
jgi:hypothetical protein